MSVRRCFSLKPTAQFLLYHHVGIKRLCPRIFWVLVAAALLCILLSLLSSLCSEIVGSGLQISCPHWVQTLSDWTLVVNAVVLSYSYIAVNVEQLPDTLCFCLYFMICRKWLNSRCWLKSHAANVVSINLFGAKIYVQEDALKRLTIGFYLPLQVDSTMGSLVILIEYSIPIFPYGAGIIPQLFCVA